MGALGKDVLLHGIHKPMDGGITLEMVSSLRDSIRIGDTLNYPRMVRDRNAAGALAERWRRVRVTGIYPNLITVKGRGPVYPQQTITYVEILTDPRIMSRK